MKECSTDWEQDIAMLAEWLKLEPGTLAGIGVSHDPWCPVLGGDGHEPCVPEYQWVHLQLHEFPKRTK